MPQINDRHLPFQESCNAGFYPCFQPRLRTCFAITYKICFMPVIIELNWIYENSQNKYLL